ncbi:MAG: SdiA-regulated domain-containing protein [Hymenobacteraceae bacterium]|nr:SdiA-regulated domain-containing protein [Hymenobacteraceae bacterium]MDX5396299.1 SdiA-regulated domain-containing protein [Hymenobacteraceae bacterium]MDX5443054.1 SdiA-regulated domain-containing protein [Hymenobacteraceae bacterium]MDX5512358.1 SdiA-regulated domain-containing protein [Hymenobacteraceae bacterium]
MKNQKKIIVAMSVLIAFLLMILLLPQEYNLFKTAHAETETKAAATVSENAATNVVVLQKWDLPEVLREVSGIAYLAENRFACVQDEKGSIFIFNTSTATIEKEIPFAGPGDYEGLTLVGETAYVVRSDGKLFEVQHFNSAKPTVNEYSNHLTADHNIEGLCYDEQHNRLLIAIKDEEPHTHDYKGIYAFDLNNKKMAEAPVYKVDLKHAAFGKVKRKKRKKVMNPSEIAIHPQSKNIFVTDAVKPKIMVMDAEGNIKKIYNINQDTFRQPEGITFGPQGELYISNEGKTGTANILKVQLNE